MDLVLQGTETLSDLSQAIITPACKGMSMKALGQSIQEFLPDRPNIFNSKFQFPIVILKENALVNNLEKMAAYCTNVKASLAPHVKTTMAPQIAQRQMEHGAHFLTVADYSQAQIFLGMGFTHLIIANEIVNSYAICAIALENIKPDHEIIFSVDSMEGLRAIQHALDTLVEGRVHLFIEIGICGGRCGIRNLKDVGPLAKHISDDTRLTLRGVSGFAGIVPGAERLDEVTRNVRDFCEKIVQAARIVTPFIPDDELIITAGGSAYFDLVVEEFHKFEGNPHIILRSGGYISHNHESYDRMYPFADKLKSEVFLPAIEVWVQVLSCPENDLAIVNLDKRDVGNDAGNPIPIKRFRDGFHEINSSVFALNDQHGYIHIDKDQDLPVGDLVDLGVSHPCTTFDKWRLIPVVNDSYDVVDLIQTFF
jgi:D-serine dehydratase